MIVRVWNGWTTLDDAERYEEHLRNAVLPELEGLTGFRGGSVLRRRDGDLFSFQVQTRWESLECIHAFAGDDVEIAVVPPDAQAVLARFDDKVQHFEEVLSSSGGETA